MSFKDIFVLPNLITLLRFFTSLFLFIFFNPEEFNPVFLISIIAIIGLSDSLDGVVARKYNLVTKLGTILDPFTDRTVFILLLLWMSNFLNKSFVYSIFVREFLILLGSIYILLTKKEIKVSGKGKFATVLLFITICLFVLNTLVEVPFLNEFSYIVIFFYFYVAFEYLYNLVFNSG